MGKAVSKQLQELLEHPDNEKEMRKVFSALDSDKDGQLSLAEWTAASEAFWCAIHGLGVQHVKEELVRLIRRCLSVVPRHLHLDVRRDDYAADTYGRPVDRPGSGST